MKGTAPAKLAVARKKETSVWRKRLEAPGAPKTNFSPARFFSEIKEFVPAARPLREDLRNWSMASGMVVDFIRTLYPASTVHAFDKNRADHLYIAFARQISHSLIFRNLTMIYMHARIQRGYFSEPQISPEKYSALVLGLHTTGWHEEALQITNDSWENYPKTLYPPRPEQLLLWFTTYFTLGSRDLITKIPFERPFGEPNEPDSPYSFLLGCWKDPDPAKVRNSLVACSEQNMARSLLGENKRIETGFDIQSWWYVPWDILAINMRRKSLGLDWVETGDPRMDEVWQNREELPLVKDDVVWPIYLELCDIIGAEPYKPRKSIDVKVNRENFDFEVIG